ncbi:hypothetical protein [Kineococcus xinjiangensis]|nr:hypothetical protein [Kineococcus xinjiangensis]
MFGPDLENLFDGVEVSLDQAVELVRQRLRDGALAATLEAEDRLIVSVGWDQDLHVSSTFPCTHAVERARAQGLSVEREEPCSGEDEGPYVQERADERFWRRVDDLALDRGEVLVETQPLPGNWGVTHYRLRSAELPSAALQPRIRPRSLVTVWPALLPDVATVTDGAVSALADGDMGRLVWALRDGSVHHRFLNDEDTDVAALSGGAVAAAWQEVGGALLDGHLMQAAVPDTDGVLRARWRA